MRAAICSVLGSLLYTMCTGRPPFRAETAVAMLRRVSEDDPRPIREINEDIPHWLCQIISKLHQKAPEHRFETAQEVELLLAQHLAHLQQPDSVPRPAIVAVKKVPPAQMVSLAEPGAVPMLRLTTGTRMLFLLRGLLVGMCTGALIVLLRKMLFIPDDFAGPVLMLAMILLIGIGYRRVPREDGRAWMFLEGALASLATLGLVLAFIYERFVDDIAGSAAFFWLIGSVLNLGIIRLLQRRWPPTIPAEPFADWGEDEEGRSRWRDLIGVPVPLDRDSDPAGHGVL